MDIARLIRPPMSIGGLEFSDRALRYLLVDRAGRAARWAQLALPPNVIEGGKVADESKLTKALNVLCHQARLARPPFYVIGVLPPPQLYSQMLAFPSLSHEELGEAVLWNAQMLLPFKPEEIYFDWEERGSPDARLSKAAVPPADSLRDSTGESKARSPLAAGVLPPAEVGASEAVLLLLAERKVVDPYLRSLAGAGFLPVALESPSRALARVVERIAELAHETSVVIRFLEEGILLAIIADGLPHFDYWRGWDRDEQELFAKAADEATMARILREELRRVVQFAKTKFTSPRFSFFILRAKEGPAARSLEERVYALVKSEFPELEIGKARLPFPTSWLPSLGAALRGFTPRAKDQMVSLAPVGTEEAWQKARREDYLSLWAKMTSVTLATLAVLVLGLNLFFAEIERKTGTPFALERGEAQKEARELRARAQAFKAQATLLEETLKGRIMLAGLIENVRAASQGVEIQRVLVERGERALRLEAVAPSAQEAIRFRERLNATGLFASVELPLSTLTTATPFTFRVVATIK